jgi:hypothetical protein
MKDYLLSNAMRFFFLVASGILWTGIFLTGVHLVHWVLFIPALFFLFAGVTGICPGIIVSKKLFGKKDDKAPEE